MEAIKLCRLDTPIIFIEARINLSRFVVTGCAAKTSAPEFHTDNIAGTDDDPVIQPGEGQSPLIIAGWARLSALLKERNNSTQQRRIRKERDLQVASSSSDHPPENIQGASTNRNR